MKDLFLGIILFCLPSPSWSQDSELSNYIEDLNQLADTIHIKKLDSLIAVYRFRDKETSRLLIKKSYDVAHKIPNRNYLASVHNLNGISFHVEREIDSAMHYLTKALELFRSTQNPKREADLLSNMGRIFGSQGRHREAVKHYVSALEIYDEIGNIHEAAGTKFNLSIPWLELGDHERAEKILYEVLEYYESIEDEARIYKVKWHLGAALANKGEYEKSIILDKELLAYYERVKDEYHVMVAHNIVGIDHYHLGRYDSTIYYCNRSLMLGEEMGDIYTIASNNQYLGAAQSKLDNHSVAIRKLEEALEQYESKGYTDEYYRSYAFLHEAQERAGLYQSAYNSLGIYTTMKDSIASSDMQAEIAEIETRYETEKKEAQITILEKEAELDDTRKKALWGGLGLLGLLAGGVIYGQGQRRKREREVASKEKEIEVERRKTAELELEFKKKELTAKALQLASKNEFLSTLEEEVAQLSSSVDASVTKASTRISRMIQNDGSDEDEWQQFSKEFSSVHQDFVDQLIDKYGSFTSGEMRLVSLLKMNLSSKEIANILRVSDEGIKKARYRLRKKMGLESAQDLGELILSI